MKAASFIALAVSLAAALIAAGAYFRVRSQAPAAPPAGTQALEARVAQLESRLREPQAASKPEAGHSHGTDEVEILRQRVANLERQAATRYPPSDTSRAVRSSPAVIEDLKKRVANQTQPLRSRALAVGALRMQGAHKTDDVIDAAMALFAEASKDAPIRALILRNLRGAENSRLADSLMQILRTDPDEDVRDEAARQLGEYLAAKPEVKAALEQAAANDASPKVKRTAEAAMAAQPRR